VTSLAHRFDVSRDTEGEFEISLEHGYDLLTDELTLDVDCRDFERSFKVTWCASQREWALVPDGKGGRGHWTGLGPDGEPDGCEQSREECPVNEAMALGAWLRTSLKVREVRERWMAESRSVHDPR
jgi:hypothetical protein